MRATRSRRLLPLVLLAALAPAQADATPLYFTLDAGATSFKWGSEATEAGFPHFESPKPDIEPGLEWSPEPLARAGFWFRGSFRWQALGEAADFTHSGLAYVDGFRVGIRFRARLIP